MEVLGWFGSTVKPRLPGPPWTPDRLRLDGVHRAPRQISGSASWFPSKPRVRNMRRNDPVTVCIAAAPSRSRIPPVEADDVRLTLLYAELMCRRWDLPFGAPDARTVIAALFSLETMMICFARGPYQIDASAHSFATRQLKSHRNWLEVGRKFA